MEGWWNKETHGDSSTFTGLFGASEFSQCDSQSGVKRRKIAQIFFSFFLPLHNKTAKSMSTAGVVTKTSCLSSYELFEHTYIRVAHKQGHNLSPTQWTATSSRHDRLYCQHQGRISFIIKDIPGDVLQSGHTHSQERHTEETHTCAAAVVTSGPVVIILQSH